MPTAGEVISPGAEASLEGNVVAGAWKPKDRRKSLCHLDTPALELIFIVQ